MTKLEENISLSNYQISKSSDAFDKDETTLRKEVEKALARYFMQVEGAQVSNLFEMVMSEVEEPLLEAVMNHTGHNQSKASIMLGLNRGTLRTKLKHYGLL